MYKASHLIAGDDVDIIHMGIIYQAEVTKYTGDWGLAHYGDETSALQQLIKSHYEVKTNLHKIVAYDLHHHEN